MLLNLCFVMQPLSHLLICSQIDCTKITQHATSGKWYFCPKRLLHMWGFIACHGFCCVMWCKAVTSDFHSKQKAFFLCMGVHFSFFLSSNKLLASYIHTLGGKTVLSSFVEKAKSFFFFFTTVYHELTSVSCVGALLLIKSSSLNFQSLCTLATQFLKKSLLVFHFFALSLAN